MCYHRATNSELEGPSVMPLDNTEAITAAAASISEPVRAALLATVLAAALALKSNERSIYKRGVEVVAVGVTGYVAGVSMQAMGLEFGYICAANAVIAYLGVEKIRGIVDRVVNAFLDRKGVKQ